MKIFLANGLVKSSFPNIENDDFLMQLIKEAKPLSVRTPYRPQQAETIVIDVREAVFLNSESSYDQGARYRRISKVFSYGFTSCVFFHASNDSLESYTAHIDGDAEFNVNDIFGSFTTKDRFVITIAFPVFNFLSGNPYEFIDEAYTLSAEPEGKVLRKELEKVFKNLMLVIKTFQDANPKAEIEVHFLKKTIQNRESESFYVDCNTGAIEFGVVGDNPGGKFYPPTCQDAVLSEENNERIAMHRRNMCLNGFINVFASSIRLIYKGSQLQILEDISNTDKREIKEILRLETLDALILHVIKLYQEKHKSLMSYSQLREIVNNILQTNSTSYIFKMDFSPSKNSKSLNLPLIGDALNELYENQQTHLRFANKRNDVEKQQLQPTLEEQLLEAAFLGHYDTCKALILEKHVDVNCVGWRNYFEGWTPLYAAAKHCKSGDEKYTNIVKLLIDKMADPLVKCSKGPEKGAYPIHPASGHHNNAIIKLFLDALVPVDIKDDCFEETPLIKAIKETEWYPSTDHTLSTVNLLVNKGANVNWLDKLGFSSALWLASERKKADVMLYLLDNHADPNLGKLSVLLHTVAEWKPSQDKTKVIKKLLDAGSNINVKDNNGNTPLEIARKMHDEDVAKLIEDKMNQRQEQENIFSGAKIMDFHQ